MLIHATNTERAATQTVANLMRERFTYKYDPPIDTWPTRAQIERMMAELGKIHDDCDGHAFACVYALADLGIKARVVLCWVEPPINEYHAVCETEAGYVLDNRFLGDVLTWGDSPLCEYTRDRMSGYFEFGEVAMWHHVKREVST